MRVLRIGPGARFVRELLLEVLRTGAMPVLRTDRMAIIVQISKERLESAEPALRDSSWGMMQKGAVSGVSDCF